MHDEPVHLFNNKTASLDAARAYIDTQLDGVIAQAIRDAWIVVEASPGAEDASAFSNRLTSLFTLHCARS